MEDGAFVTQPLTEDASGSSEQSNTPRVCFLGWCQQAVQVTKGQEPFWHMNLIGLTRSLVSPLYPMNLNHQKFLLAVYGLRVNERIKVTFRDRKGPTTFWIEVFSHGGTARTYGKQGTNETQLPVDSRIKRWSFFLQDTGDNLTITEPSTYNAYYTTESSEQYLCSVSFLHAPANPFTDEEINAIRSDPNSMKFVRFRIECNDCSDAVRTYAGIEVNKKLEDEGWIPHSKLPDRFKCSCGKTNINLEATRTSLHVLLKRQQDRDLSPIVDSVRLYEKSALEEKCVRFSALLRRKCSEEEIHRFLVSNPIFMSPFNAQRLMNKKPVLTKYVTDFAILNHKKELILIEIEKPSIRLLRKDKELTADFNHAIGQVRDWLQVFEDHKSASLECLGMKLDEVVRIRGVVIGGRTPEPSQLNRRLRSILPRDIDFFTYDDLLKSVRDVIKHLETV